MKEKERKALALIEQQRIVKDQIKKLYAPKDIGMLIAHFSSMRYGLFEEFIENLLNESLLSRLEKYGENSSFWKNETFTYQNSNAKSERPSAAWLHAKVKRYEYEAS